MALARILFLLPFVAALPFVSSRASWPKLSFPAVNDDIADTNEIPYVPLTALLPNLTFAYNAGYIYETYDVCQTKECHQIADYIIDAMDKSADPCDNFWTYTCGKWGTNHPLLPGMAKTGRSDGYAPVSQYLHELLMEKSQFDIKPVKQAKTWYKMCMDTEKLDRIGLQPIVSFIKGIGGWPIMREDDGSDDYYDYWPEIDQYYRHLTGRSAFYQLEVYPKDDDYGHGKIIIFAPNNLRDRKNLVNSDLYFEMMMNTVKKLMEFSGNDMSGTKYMEESRKVIEFEKRLLQLKLIADGDRFPGININGIFKWLNEDEAENVEDVIDWKSEIERSFAQLGISIVSDNLVFMSKKYMRGIHDLLSKTSSKTIVNYIHWNFVISMLPYTTESMRDQIFKLESNGGGKRERWMECLEEMKMDLATTHMYAKKYLPESVRNSAKEILENIRTALTTEIDNSNGLDETTKSLLKQKAENVTMAIGIPEWHKNATAVINFYKGLQIDSEYFYTILAYMKFDMQKRLKVYLLNETYPPSDIVYGFANFRQKPILIDIGIKTLQPPPLLPGVPNNVNYGLIGRIIGHEMGHGFDPVGIRLGKTGLALSNDALKTYDHGSNCLVEQYTNLIKNASTDDYGIKNYESLGKSTLNENVADIIGLEMAFNAYKYHMRNNGGSNDRKLPGLKELSDDQLYFVAFASSYCEILSPEYKNAIFETDGHMINYFRVIGPIINSNGFAKTFNCPKGSPMNPVEKCDIWNKSEKEMNTEDMENEVGFGNSNEITNWRKNSQEDMGEQIDEEADQADYE